MMSSPCQDTLRPETTGAAWGSCGARADRQAARASDPDSSGYASRLEGTRRTRDPELLRASLSAACGEGLSGRSLVGGSARAQVDIGKRAGRSGSRSRIRLACQLAAAVAQGGHARARPRCFMPPGTGSYAHALCRGRLRIHQMRPPESTGSRVAGAADELVGAATATRRT